jgi:hypothetical protein
VIPVTFSSSSKSDLGWRLVGLIESGRLKEYAADGAVETRLFWRQLAAAGYEVRPGPGKLLRWGVVDGVDWRARVARGSGGEAP